MQENNIRAVDRVKHIEEIVHRLKHQWLSSRSLPNTNTIPLYAHQHQSSGPDSRHGSLADTLGQRISELINNLRLNPTPKPSEETLELDDKLEVKDKQALLCFSLFEEGHEIKKRDLVYWWVGQQLIQDGVEAEAAANQILKKLVDLKVIEQVIRRGKKNSSRYKMTRQFRSKIQDHINNKVGLLKKTGSLGVVNQSGQPFDGKSEEHIEALFNPGRPFLKIQRDRLDKMKNVKVIHLGRWCNDPEVHLEVESIEFLESLKRLKHVRLLSLKGMSRIMQLPGSVCKCSCLRVLDLRACPNLEVLPKEIGKLQNLTHLDLSECYLLDHIPKEITSLTRLQVLEGFVISDLKSGSFCSFKDLSTHLGKSLKKLSMSTRDMSFPSDEHLEDFADFKELAKLKVVFVRTSSSNIQEPSVKKTLRRSQSVLVRLTTMREKKEPKPAGLPPKLLKLELQAMPEKVATKLLANRNYGFENLKKLYIIGGSVSDLGRGKREWTTVETIQLKYLSRLHMDWRQFKRLFPKVTYLEMVQCPNLSFFPCDPNGVWKQPPS